MFCPISFLCQFQIHVLKTEDTMVKKGVIQQVLTIIDLQWIFVIYEKFKH